MLPFGECDSSSYIDGLSRPELRLCQVGAKSHWLDEIVYFTLFSFFPGEIGQPQQSMVSLFGSGTSRSTLILKMIDITAWLGPEDIWQARILAVDIDISVFCDSVAFCRS